MEYNVKSIAIVYGIVILGITIGRCQFPRTDECLKIKEIDCDNGYKAEGNETVCCSDLVTYPNLCFFAQKKCEIPDLTIIRPGHCDATTLSPQNLTDTTPLPVVTTASTSDIIKDVFCTNKDQFNCGDELDPVCGTDFVFYQNNCEFAKAQCNATDLRTQELNMCKS